MNQPPKDKAPKCVDCKSNQHLTCYRVVGRDEWRWSPVHGWQPNHRRALGEACREEREPRWFLNHWFTFRKRCGPRGRFFIHKQDENWPAGG